MPENQSTVSVLLQPDLRNVNSAFKSIEGRSIKLNLDSKGFSQPLGQIKGSLSEFDKSMAASNARVLAFGASAGAIYGVSRAFKEMVTASINVEKGLADININLGLTQKNLQGFGGQIFNIARETSKSFDETAKASAEFARQGLGAVETLKRTRDALILSRLANLDSITATEDITAAINSFNQSALTSTEIVSKFARVDANFAVSSKDLAEAIKRVGSTSQQAGIDINNLIGIVTAAQQTTSRGGAVIGNALKTIFTRLESSSTIEQLRALGVEIDSTQNGLQKLQAIAQRVKVVNPLDAAAIRELAAGKLQINILNSLLPDLANNYGVAARAARDASEATNEANQKNEQLNKTLSATINSIKTSLTQIGSGLGGTVVGGLFGKIEEGLREISGGNRAEGEGKSIGEKIGSGLAQGLSNFLTGPGAVLVSGVVASIGINFARQGVGALKSILGQLQTSIGITDVKKEQLYLEGQIANVLKSEEGLLQRIQAGTAGVVNVQNILLAGIEREILLRETAARFATSGLTAIKGAGYRIEEKPGAQPTFVRVKTKAAVGLIPETEERIGALQGGYTPGAVKEMTIPNYGRVIYNTAEKVRTFPGLAQPAIIPPQGSKAGVNYQKEFKSTHGFDPYKAEGLVPNYHDNSGDLGQIPNFALPKPRGAVDFLGRSFFNAVEFLNEKHPRVTSLIDDFEILRDNYMPRSRKGGGVRAAIKVDSATGKRTLLYNADISDNTFNIVEDLSHELAHATETRSGISDDYISRARNVNKLGLSDYLADENEVRARRIGSQVKSKYFKSIINSSSGFTPYKAEGLIPNFGKKEFLDFFLKNSQQSPLPISRGERIMGFSPEDFVRFAFKDNGLENGLELNTLQAFPQGKGVGSKFMDLLAQKADEEGVNLNLNAYPLFGKGGKKAQNKLFKFYNKFGFEKDFPKSSLMSRNFITKDEGLIPNFAQFDTNLLKRITQSQPRPSGIGQRNKQQMEAAKKLAQITGIPVEDLLMDEYFQNEFRKFVPNFVKVYHGTQSRKNFREFRKGDIGFHGGTPQAANDLLKSVAPRDYSPKYLGEYGPNARIFPLDFDIKNPLRLDDIDSFHSPNTLIEHLLNKKIVTQLEINEAVSSNKRLQNITTTKTGHFNDDIFPTYQDFAPLRKLLNKKGFDGIVYQNKVEDAGSDSYIAFYRKQIKYLDQFSKGLIPSFNKESSIPNFANFTGKYYVRTDDSQNISSITTKRPNRVDGFGNWNVYELDEFLSAFPNKKEQLIDIFKKRTRFTSRMGRSSGLIPSFSALDSAITREKNAGINPSLIQVDADSRLKSSFNPAGLGVFNKIDEPGGLQQGISRALSEGRNPKTYNIPNAAEGRVPNFVGPPGGPNVASPSELAVLQRSDIRFQAFNDKLIKLAQETEINQGSYLNLFKEAKKLSEKFSNSGKVYDELSLTIRQVRKDADKLRIKKEPALIGFPNGQATPPPLQAQLGTQLNFPGLSPNELINRTILERSLRQLAISQKLAEADAKRRNVPLTAASQEDFLRRIQEVNPDTNPPLVPPRKPVENFGPSSAPFFYQQAIKRLESEEKRAQFETSERRARLSSSVSPFTGIQSRLAGLQSPALQEGLLINQLRLIKQGNVDALLNALKIRGIDTSSVGSVSASGTFSLTEREEFDKKTQLLLNTLNPSQRKAFESLSPAKSSSAAQIAAENAAENARLEKEQLAAKRANRLQNFGLAASIGGPLFGGVVSAAFGDETLGARRGSAIANAGGNALGFAGLGASVGGLPGLGIGALVGVLAGLPEIIRSWNDVLPDLQRNIEKTTERLNKNRDTFQKFIEVTQKLSDESLLPETRERLKKEQVELFSSLPPNAQSLIPQAKTLSGVIEKFNESAAADEIEKNNETKRARLIDFLRNSRNFDVKEVRNPFNPADIGDVGLGLGNDALANAFSLKTVLSKRGEKDFFSNVLAPTLGVVNPQTKKSLLEILAGNSPYGDVGNQLDARQINAGLRATKIDDLAPKDLLNKISETAEFTGIEGVKELIDEILKRPEIEVKAIADKFRTAIADVKAGKSVSAALDFTNDLIGGKEKENQINEAVNRIFSDNYAVAQADFENYLAGLIKLKERESNAQLGDIERLSELERNVPFITPESRLQKEVAIKNIRLESGLGIELESNKSEAQKNLDEQVNEIAKSIQAGALQQVTGKDLTSEARAKILSQAQNFAAEMREITKNGIGSLLVPTILESRKNSLLDEQSLPSEKRVAGRTDEKIKLEINSVQRLLEVLQATNNAYTEKDFRATNAAKSATEANEREAKGKEILLRQERALQIGGGLGDKFNINSPRDIFTKSLLFQNSTSSINRASSALSIAEFFDKSQLDIPKEIRDTLENTALERIRALNPNVNEDEARKAARDQVLTRFKEGNPLGQGRLSGLPNQEEIVDIGRKIIKDKNIEEANDARINKLIAERLYLLGEISAEQLQQVRNADRLAKIATGTASVKELFGGFGDSLKYNTQDFFKEINDGAVEVGQTLKTSFAGAIKSFADGSKTAFQDFGIAVAQKIFDKTIDINTNLLFNALGQAGSSIAGSFSRNANGGLIKEYNRGGMVMGGSGVRDDVPALLNDGEYVIKKSSVNKYGPDFLNQLNMGGVPKRYASGGSAQITLQNEFLLDNNKQPTRGERRIDPRLSNFALSDENSLATQRRIRTEDDLEKYLKNKSDVLAAYKRSKKQRLQAAYFSAAIGIAGAGLTSAFGRTAGAVGAGAGNAGSSAYGGSSYNDPGQAEVIGLDRYQYNNRLNALNNYQASEDYQISKIYYGSGYGRAMGGYIKKYNMGGRADSIPALLMGGEYVLNKDTVSRMGVPYLEKLNGGRIEKGYAAGGYVGGNASPAGLSNTDNSQRMVDGIYQLIDLLGAKNEKKNQNTQVSEGQAITNNFTFATTITIDKNGNAKAETQTTNNKEGGTDKERGKQLGDSIGNIFYSLINKELRPNGLILEAIKRG